MKKLTTKQEVVIMAIALFIVSVVVPITGPWMFKSKEKPKTEERVNLLPQEPQPQQKQLPLQEYEWSTEYGTMNDSLIADLYIRDSLHKRESINAGSYWALSPDCDGIGKYQFLRSSVTLLSPYWMKRFNKKHPLTVKEMFENPKTQEELLTVELEISKKVLILNGLRPTAIHLIKSHCAGTENYINSLARKWSTENSKK